MTLLSQIEKVIAAAVDAQGEALAKAITQTVAAELGLAGADPSGSTPEEAPPAPAKRRGRKSKAKPEPEPEPEPEEVSGDDSEDEDDSGF